MLKAHAATLCQGILMQVRILPVPFSAIGSVRRTSNHSQQRLLREEVLSLTQENAQSTGILRIDLRFRSAESWRFVCFEGGNQNGIHAEYQEHVA